ncbi:PhoX family phosphatase [Micrococcus sp. EYE_162]|uniref:PhoX family protein n=1 Tax=unclassified Micrococcus TaxID=2620948 RepID=UPI00200316B6|nr:MULTISPECIES: PhoX family phosphatase [unclassified Micrococcus]MCK6095255.1 PhoX family phosphatase [Micrococcus sp. EYE_212]MCK6171202.1 PhoX family phosphatase [Micrococcus sp. EYE_162]
MLKRLLPMSGHTRGNRSAVTCELKCGNACSHPIPNTSDNATFQQIAETAISRRSALMGGTGLAAAVVIGANMAQAPEALADNGNHPTGGGKLDFTAIKPVPRTVDDVTVPEGYEWGTIIRWGDPLFKDSEEFDIQHQTGKSAAGQFGYNNDYLNIISDGGDDRSGYLVSNHEYTNENIMFSPEYIISHRKDVVDAGIQSHGLSVVELERAKRGQKWEYVQGGRRNRRITGTTPFKVTGPAAGHALLKTVEDPTGTRVLGTLNNCAGGTTPWGTVLSGEENFNQYFKGRGTAEEKRYGIGTKATQRGWELFYDRFDLTKDGYENEANRFGWVVEVDPEDPTSTPVKHTLLGRFKHEAGTAVLSGDGRAVVYSGDDERHDYLYKFVSAKKFVEGDKKHNMRLLDEGTLYVAKFKGDSPKSEIDGKGTLPSDGAFDGAGEWIALATDKKSLVPGMSLAEVLVYTRLAADKMGATKMDRPEDVETNPVNGKVYMALTNNTKRTEVDEANPVVGNRDGHVVELTEKGGDHTATTFNWVILLLAGDPAVSSSAYFAGYPKELVSPISCPDNVAFDSEGNLWISTDGQPGTIGLADALHKVTLDGPERGRVEQFLAVPRDAETCGPVIHDRDNSVFVNVQHPGEDGNWGAHTSSFPDFLSPAGPVQVGDKVAAPRPSVVQVFNVTGNNGVGKGSGKEKGNKGKGSNGHGNSAFGHAQGNGPKK